MVQDALPLLLPLELEYAPCDAGVAAFGAGVTAFGAGVAPFGAGVADLGAPFFFVIATRLTKRRKQEQWVVPESLLSK